MKYEYQYQGEWLDLEGLTKHEHFDVMLRSGYPEVQSAGINLLTKLTNVLPFRVIVSKEEAQSMHLDYALNIEHKLNQ